MSITVTDLFNRQNVFFDLAISKYDTRLEHVLLIYRIINLQSKLDGVIVGHIEDIAAYFNENRHLWLSNDFDVYIEINEDF